MKEILDEIIERLEIFHDMYTFIRIIDPINRKSYVKQKAEAEYQFVEGHCYDFWKKGRQCANCLSRRTLKTNKYAFKLEMKEERLFLIQTYPVELNNKHYIIEMLKDVTDQGMFINEKADEYQELSGYIKNLNSKIIEDQVTEIYNRRFLEEQLPLDLERAKADSDSLAVIIVDVDRFKQINDTQGHPAGDSILKQLSSIFKDSIRASSDWIARYGGDEFIILLYHVTEEQVIKITEDFRRKIEEAEFYYEDKELHFTCSFGVCLVNGGDYDYNRIIGIADESLYEAKRNGKNKVVIRTDKGALNDTVNFI